MHLSSSVQHKPTSTESQTVIELKQTEGSTAIRVTTPEASDFESGPACTECKSNPTSVANVCTHHQHTDPCLTQTYLQGHCKPLTTFPSFTAVCIAAVIQDHQR